MSIGLSIIAAMLGTGSQTALRQIRREYFTPDEVHAFDFVANYNRQFGGLPSEAALRENGIILTPATGNFAYHLQQIRDRTIYNAVRGNHEPLLRAMEVRDMQEVVAAIERMRAEVVAVNTFESVQTIIEAAPDVLASYEAAHRDGRVGVYLGWDELDQITAGAMPGDVVALVARPNVGKSYSLAWIALRAWERGHAVLFITLEMTVLQIARRMVGVKARLDPDMMRRGMLSARGETVLRQTIEAITVSSAPLHLVGGNIKKTVPQVDSLIQEYQPDLTVVDASYLLRSERQYKSKNEMLADIGEDIKYVALDRNQPIVHSVQLGRRAEETPRKNPNPDRPGKKPTLAMIYGTDVVGQIASVAIAVRHGKPPFEDTRRRFDVIKNREGRLGSFETNWLFHPINFNEVGDDDYRALDVETGWMV